MTGAGMRSDGLDAVRAVADAVLFEGYLLYPYRATSAKNVSRWQFGVLGPPGGAGEAATMQLQTVLRAPTPHSALEVHLRFLQLQRRQVYDVSGEPVDSLIRAGATHLSWDEAVEQEVVVDVDVADLHGAGVTRALHVDGGEDSEPLPEGGHVVRRRWPLYAELALSVEPAGDHLLLAIGTADTHPEPPAELAGDKDWAARRSLLGAHLIVAARGWDPPGAFVSVVDPPEDAREAATACRQDRCWPFLAGWEGRRGTTQPAGTDLLLGSPIILYDYPQIAPESAGALFDGTEIDEILTLRVMTMTDAEKAEARVTDPRAAQIIDRCDAMSPAELQALHGTFRDPHGAAPAPSPAPHSAEPAEPPQPAEPWWDPAADASVDPETDTVLV
ncbi:MAG: hypothetical protein ACRDPB_00095, partial [Nocardioidaceae bacterium]